MQNFTGQAKVRKKILFRGYRASGRFQGFSKLYAKINPVKCQDSGATMVWRGDTILPDHSVKDETHHWASEYT